MWRGSAIARAGRKFISLTWHGCAVRCRCRSLPPGERCAHTSPATHQPSPENSRDFLVLGAAVSHRVFTATEDDVPRPGCPVGGRAPRAVTTQLRVGARSSIFVWSTFLTAVRHSLRSQIARPPHARAARHLAPPCSTISLTHTTLLTVPWPCPPSHFMHNLLCTPPSEVCPSRLIVPRLARAERGEAQNLHAALDVIVVYVSTPVLHVCPGLPCDECGVASIASWRRWHVCSRCGRHFCPACWASHACVDDASTAWTTA